MSKLFTGIEKIFIYLQRSQQQEKLCSELPGEFYDTKVFAYQKQKFTRPLKKKTEYLRNTDLNN